MPRLNLTFATLFLALALASPPVLAQSDQGGGFDFQKEFGQIGGNAFGESNQDADDGPKVTIEAFIVPSEMANDRQALLVVRAKMAKYWHLYSMTQKKGGPPATVITIEQSNEFEFPKGSGFSTKDRPHVRTLDDIWPDLPIEEHSGQVTWTAPIRLAQGVDPASLRIKGELTEGQVCRDGASCIPFSFIDTHFTATLGTAEQIASVRPAPPAATGEFVAAGGNPTIRGHIEPKTVAPGETAKLVLTIEPLPDWHVYERRDDVPEGPRPTIIPLVSTAGLPASAPVADTQVVEEDGLRYHEGPTTWTIDLPIPKDAKSGEYAIEGYVGFQVCKDTACLTPTAVQFRGAVNVGEKTAAGQSPLGFDESGYRAAQEAMTRSIAWSDGDSGNLRIDSAGSSINYAQLPLMIAFSLLGGLILNLMPCVLPVVGLKILSFAEQAGQHRAKVFGLNLAYSIGLLSVFLVLASLAVFLNLGWGEQFTSTWFNVAMCALVFAMALSFLGVWEIPLPGFVGGEAADKLQTSEGPTGAFFKGVLTTVLATPCSGPFLGPVFGFTLKQPWIVTYVIFGAIGLGMALPYLLVGAFPSLVKFLPRPGAWMNTFKQMMGFVLLGTVVFLFSFMDKDYLVATFALLIGIWIACWWVGRTSLTASAATRATAWGGGIVTAALVGLVAFNLLVPKQTKIPWQPYSPAALAKAQAEGKTVMVDFTADWCLTCKTNLKFAINTDKVYEKLDENRVVPLLADWTKPSDEIKKSLAQLNSKSIPVLAFYPADRPGEVIVLRDLISQSQVLEALEKAGPSTPVEKEDEEPSARTAMIPPNG